MPCSICAYRAVWDAEPLRDVVREYVRETIGDADGMLVLDETGFLKKGTKSVGVQRQYSGTAGRIENCQIGVFLTDTSQAGQTLLDRELSLPKSWTNDPQRCREAEVPTEVRFATKPELAARMLWRTLDGGVQARWVLGDRVSGSHRPLRRGLEARSQSYALAVACQEQVEVQDKRQRVDQVAQHVATGDWQQLSAGDGSSGNPSRPTLLPRRSRTSNASGDWLAGPRPFEYGGSATSLLCPLALSPGLVSLPAGLVILSAYTPGHRLSLSLQTSLGHAPTVTTVVLALGIMIIVFGIAIGRLLKRKDAYR